jgi:hypothetical protein
LHSFQLFCNIDTLRK